MQWLLEKSENELPTETLAKATRTGQTVQSSPKGNEDRKRGLGSSDVTGQVSVKGPSTSMSPRSDGYSSCYMTLIVSCLSCFMNVWIDR